MLFPINMKQDILAQIRTFIEQRDADKTWTPGKDFVNYAGPYFDEHEYLSVIDTLLDGWLVMGDKSLKFEKEFPKQFGKEHGILTNSGSSSNLLMMSTMTSKRGYNLPKGTKVLMPIAGFPTTLNPTLQLGFEPIFLDIELDTLKQPDELKTLKQSDELDIIEEPVISKSILTFTPLENLDFEKIISAFEKNSDFLNFHPDFPIAIFYFFHFYQYIVCSPKS